MGCPSHLVSPLQRAQINTWPSPHSKYHSEKFYLRKEQLLSGLFISIGDAITGELILKLGWSGSTVCTFSNATDKYKKKYKIQRQIQIQLENNTNMKKIQIKFVTIYKSTLPAHFMGAHSQIGIFACLVQIVFETKFVSVLFK